MIRSGRADLAGGERGEPEDREEQDELLHHVVTLAPRSRCVGTNCVTFPTEVSGHLVGSAAFKAAGTGDPRPAGSIPVHLRHTTWCYAGVWRTLITDWSRVSERQLRLQANAPALPAAAFGDCGPAYGPQ